MTIGTYLAKTDTEGSVLFRVDGVVHTLRKNKDIEIAIKDERTAVSYPESYMTFTLQIENDELQVGGERSEPKQEAKEEIIETPESEPKQEAKEEIIETPVKKGNSRRNSVKIETEEK